jgi:predicted small secreted protein
MKTKTLIKISVLISALVLSACGTSKSTATGTTESASRVEVDSAKPLASCNQMSKAGLMTMNIANVIGSDGKANQDWVKIKFTSVDASISSTGYFLRLYKWRVINNSVQLDSVPLSVYAYSLSSGQATSNPSTGIYTNSINSQTGFMVKLNDDLANPYQVIKVVAYKSDGTVIDNQNVLIPQFFASPADYKLNSDGTVRADLLQQLHPLYGQDVTGWSFSQMQQVFDQYCF